MSKVTIYHNPRCSKSRQTLALLMEHGVDADIITYLDHPPSTAQLQQLLDLLGMSARGLLRSKEATYAQLGLDNPDKTNAELLSAMHEHPILIERPIVVKDGRAVIGRPPENVLELL